MDYLSSDEQIQLDSFRHGDSFAEETLIELQRILTSKKFARVQQRAKDFLGFVVAKTLLGRSADIKESTIAVHVYSEPADYDSVSNTKIRVAAADLRQRLTDYFALEGRNDPIEIVIPIGTYAPEINDRRISIAVGLFENWNPKGDQSHLCTSLTDDIVYKLKQTGARASRPAIKEDIENKSRYNLRGSLECRGELLRINLSLGDMVNGEIICSASFEERRDDLLRLSLPVAEIIAKAAHARTGLI